MLAKKLFLIKSVKLYNKRFLCDKEVLEEYNKTVEIYRKFVWIYKVSPINTKPDEKYSTAGICDMRSHMAVTYATTQNKTEIENELTSEIDKHIDHRILDIEESITILEKLKKKNKEDIIRFEDKIRELRELLNNTDSLKFLDGRNRNRNLIN